MRILVLNNFTQNKFDLPNLLIIGLDSFLTLQLSKSIIELYTLNCSLDIYIKH